MLSKAEERVAFGCRDEGGWDEVALIVDNKRRIQPKAVQARQIDVEQRLCERCRRYPEFWRQKRRCDRVIHSVVRKAVYPANCLEAL